MDKKLKAKWVEALKSGHFHQMTPASFYEEDGKYCCLGVLASVAGRQLQDAHRPWFDSIGITDEAVNAFIDVNDSGVPFEMIAGLIDEAL